jgi:predicted PurR-regulated permease PerM
MMRRGSKSLRVLAFVAVGCVLYVGQVAFIPVALALFFALLLSPPVGLLQRIGIPRGLAAVIVIVALLGAGAAVVDAVWAPATEWFAHAPQTLRKIDQRIRPVRTVIAKVDDITARAGRLTSAPNPNASAAAPAAPAPSGGSTAIAMTQSVLEAFTVIPLTLFFLAGGPALLARLGAAYSGAGASSKALQVTEAIRSEVGRYYATIALINLGLGSATAGVVALLGMPNPILWGTLAGLLNFIPYLGPITTIAILAAAALVTINTIGGALAVPGAFLVLHGIESLVVQPLLVGHRLDVSALLILLAVWLGFWFWGVPGVILAVPSLVALKVAAEHIESLRPVQEFLATNPRWRASLRRARAEAAQEPGTA